MNDDLHRNAQRVVEAARALGFDLQVHSFPEGTRTAADAAAAIGVEVGAIVKSLVLRSDDGPVLALVSGANRADLAAVAAALGVTGVHQADARTAREATGFPVGGTPPFGHPAPLTTVTDADLLGFDEVWAAAGTPNLVFPIPPDDLVRATAATVARIAE